jgi:phosphatidylglycerol:prolipoprotein diacylglycerol transferase
VVLWLIIWLLRNKKPFKGFLLGIYVAGYGFFRFILEYFREPDADLGYRITLVKTDIPPALFTSPLNFSTGQVFSFIMILCGLLWLFIASRLPDKEPVRVYPSPSQETVKGKTPRSRHSRRRQQEK